MNLRRHDDLGATHRDLDLDRRDARSEPSIAEVELEVAAEHACAELLRYGPWPGPLERAKDDAHALRRHERRDAGRREIRDERVELDRGLGAVDESEPAFELVDVECAVRVAGGET